jgi:hypothetical protein
VTASEFRQIRYAQTCQQSSGAETTGFFSAFAPAERANDRPGRLLGRVHAAAAHSRRSASMLLEEHWRCPRCEPRRMMHGLPAGLLGFAAARDDPEAALTRPASTTSCPLQRR